MDIEFAAGNLMDRYPDQLMTLEKKEDEIAVTFMNPNGGDPVKVYLSSAEMTFIYGTQHAHFGYKDMDDLAEYINGFLRGETAAIEFYRDGEDVMGGSRDLADIDFSSAESLIGLFEAGFPRGIKKKTLKWYRTGEWKVTVRQWDVRRDSSVSFRFKDGRFETDAPVPARQER